MNLIDLGTKLGKIAIKEGITEVDDLLDLVDEHCECKGITDTTSKHMVGEYAMIYYARNA
jgi:hypothetical protein